MAQNDSGFRAFPVGASALTAGTRVSLSSGLAVAAGAPNASALGVAIGDAPANGIVTVKLNTAGGTHEMKAGGVISAGAVVYPAASGKILASQTSSNNAIGIALEAATADGDVIEVVLGVNAHS
jgi:predicted RecA/RadA family phage recombinase